MPALKDISIEEIENGTVISYRYAETYETKKKFFTTSVEAKEWLCGEIQQEIEHHAPRQVEYKTLHSTDEIPF